MTIGERFKASSARTVKKFASLGVLLQPTSDSYNPVTGEQSKAYAPHNLEYVVITNATTTETTLKASSFRQRLVYFTTDHAPDETWSVLTGTDAGSYSEWVDETQEVWVDEFASSWVAPNDSSYKVMDVKRTEKIEVADVVVGYYALLEYRE